MCMKDNLPDRADGPLIMVIGDRSEPLMLALLDLEASRPGMLDNLIEVLPSDGSDLSITEIRLLRPPYKRCWMIFLSCFKITAMRRPANFWTAPMSFDYFLTQMKECQG